VPACPCPLALSSSFDDLIGQSDSSRSPTLSCVWLARASPLATHGLSSASHATTSSDQPHDLVRHHLLLMLTAVVFPGFGEKVDTSACGPLCAPQSTTQGKAVRGRRSAHDCMSRSDRRKGCLPCSSRSYLGTTHANKLLLDTDPARARHSADFTDISPVADPDLFLLYFAPTPGVGLAELTSAAVMSLYVSARVDAELTR